VFRALYFAEMDRRHKITILVASALVSVLAAFLLAPVAQDPAFHRFADSRAWLKIPNFANVVSNIFFLAVAIAGYWEMARRQINISGKVIYGLLFAGIFLTGLGSAYYHWRPDNDRLIWDRIPMTIVFMSLLAATMAEWVDERAGIWLLWPLVTLGIFSVLWWHHTEELGHGDLRLYGWVQFFPMLCIPLILLMFGKTVGYKGVRSLLWVVVWYIVAKVFEHFDRGIFQKLGFVSGHTLKHIAAAVSTGYLVRMFEEKHSDTC
jgi:ceramidase